MDKNKLTYDYIAGTDIHVWQHKNMFRINSDTAQLAHFMKINKDDRVLDIGTNNAALLLAAHRFDPSFLCGVDIQDEACELARFNLAENGISDAEIICGDFTEMNLSGFDVVVCNPPFFQMDDHFKPALTPRSIARHEFFLPLSELFCKIRLSLKENGRLYMVHRSERLADLMEECRKNRLEIKTLQLVYDARKEQAVSVLIEAVLGGKKGCQVPHPILLKKDGTFERNPFLAEAENE